MCIRDNEYYFKFSKRYHLSLLLVDCYRKMNLVDIIISSILGSRMHFASHGAIHIFASKRHIVQLSRGRCVSPFVLILELTRVLYNKNVIKNNMSAQFRFKMFFRTTYIRLQIKTINIMFAFPRRFHSKKGVCS